MKQASVMKIHLAQGNLFKKYIDCICASYQSLGLTSSHFCYHQYYISPKINRKSTELAGNSDSRMYQLIRYWYTAYVEMKFIQWLAQFSLPMVSVGGGEPRFQLLPLYNCLLWSWQYAVFTWVPVLKVQFQMRMSYHRFNFQEQERFYGKTKNPHLLWVYSISLLSKPI